MLIQKSYKTELNPNNKQKTLFVKACGVRRFAYNWGLNESNKFYETTGKGLRSGELLKRLNKIKDEQFPWMKEVSTYVVQSAMHDLDEAFDNFFRRVKNGEKPGFPNYKSKRNGLGGFRLYQSICVEPNRIRIPRIGWVRLKEKEYLSTSNVKINSVTIKEKAGKWFVSLQVEEEIKIPENNGSIVALDLGLNSFVHDSDNNKVVAPKPLKKHLKRLQKLQRKHSKKKLGGKNREKHRKKIAKLYLKITNIRNDFLHKLSTKLTKTKSTIIVEDLNVSGMMKNHCLARNISDISWYEFVRQLEYKSQWYGCEVFKVDRFYPSTKLCSNCGNKKAKIGLSERVYHCDKCSFERSRDYNAALNLLKFYSEKLPIDHGDVKPLEMCSVEPSVN
ncbi:transposase [Candidatus Parcubacteria bacterium]|nr:MAG: transposase [Candidatus Parcubacteria bacterium]